MPKQRSLRHEYALYLEREIEAYKDSVSRATLLSLGDEAVAALGAQAQTTLTEMVVWEEVDRLIAERLRLPGFATWSRRRRRHLAGLRDAARCGLTPDGVVASALRAAAGDHVLLAGGPAEEATLFSAAHGCNVTVLTGAPDSLDRLFAAADDAGVGSQVRGCVCELGAWDPDVPFRVVVCAPDALGPLSVTERATAMDGLRRATAVGGVHLLHEGRRGGRDGPEFEISLDEWRSWYPGWSVSTDQMPGTARRATLIARRPAESAATPA
jgi:hypothetical protein